MKLSGFMTQPWLRVSVFAVSTLILFTTFAQKTLAHHAMGGKTPANCIEGFISGLAHPIIGLDHFAFVVASGLLALSLAYGFLIPITFVFSTLIGTAIHLQKIDLPSPEIIVAISVILFGILLTVGKNINLASSLKIIVLSALAGLAGIFHGYAYGESIIGAQMTPLLAYLAGFAIIQLAIALGVCFLGTKFGSLSLQKFLGLAISSIGVIFLSSAMLG